MVIKFFFERQQEARGELPTTFTYDNFPETLKKQIILIWQRQQNLEYTIKSTVQDLRLALGSPTLADGQEIRKRGETAWFYTKEIKNFLINQDDIDMILTIIEAIAHHLDDELIEEINYRMLRAGIGYKYIENNLIKVEDETFFGETTAPCLSILSKNGFETTKKYFLDAYDELKQQKYDDALTDCGQAIESILKTQFSRHGIDYNEGDSLIKLLNKAKDTIIAPSFMQDYLNNLFKVIEGAGTWRNQEGAHGETEGAERHVNETFVRFVINQTATNILFFAEAKFKNN